MRRRLNRPGKALMKIAFVDQPLSNFDVPPTNSVAIGIYEVARRLAERHEVVIYTLRGRRQSKVECLEGIQYRRISIGRDYRPVGRFYRLLESSSRFVKQPYASILHYVDYILQVANDLRTQRCDIVHVPTFSQYAPIIRAFNPRVKIVLHMHCEWLSLLDRGMIERRLNHVDLIVGCSAYITEKVQWRFPQFAERCRTVHNGVDIHRFFRANGHPTLKEDEAKRLLFVGRVSPEKGVHVLLDAFQIVAERCPGAQLEIVGSKQQLPLDLLLSLSDDKAVTELASFYDGRSRFSYLSHLQTQLRSAGLADQVILTDSIPHAQLANHYRRANVVINPSFSESFGMSLIEAMSCEVPVVATRVGGMIEIVEESNAGLLVEPGDALSLAEAILHLLANNDRREAMGRAGRQWVLDRFSWEKVVATLLDQYERLNKRHA